MNTLETIMKQLNNKDALQQLGNSINAKPDDVKKVAELGIPALMEALNRNTNTQEGAQSLARALEQHQDDDVDDIASFLKNVDTDDGAKIIEHILGGKSSNVTSKLAKKAGMSSEQTRKLLIQFAPLLLGLLGKKKKEDNLDASGVSNLTSTLSSLLGASNNNSGSGSSLLNLASSLLDDDDDDNNSSSLGSILGGLGSLFGKKKK